MATWRILVAFAFLSAACGGDDDDDPDAGPGDGGDASPGVAECGPLPASCALDCDAEPGAEYCAQQSFPQSSDCGAFCYEGRCCACEDADGAGRAWSPHVIDCARPSAECPNYIASDENCGNCTKAWGMGASYCADTCTTDEDCDGRANPWASEGAALVCHPDGYCTRACAGEDECHLTALDSNECDPAGACSFCLDCF